MAFFSFQAEAVDQLQVENRELRGVQERLERKERRARDLKKKNAHLGEQHTALLEDYEACQEQASPHSSLAFFCDPVHIDFRLSIYFSGSLMRKNTSQHSLVTQRGKTKTIVR